MKKKKMKMTLALIGMKNQKAIPSTKNKKEEQVMLDLVIFIREI